ncbi:MAG: hypothetical protein EOS26_00475 [Mesorhizobium sp.]|uniref:NAD(P)-dependent oxidoreductase n=1 Tax=Mesorhizobium sp. TaxID=1871066 RepID=UPI000FE71855|nr:NAD(P)-dependent oxidoreductase [Mesorhizobium sp.]RWB36203.1 MAG: hypothetical protein EOQ41_01075 [Mesorhizobium sp.]RWC40713.1 MAG: hypothetical protein EOS28_22395 [Mesorhizobium sp.]RWF79661.1 MAG: hypothetical protein EOS26_00475 [Mesorhizobium sp.]TIX83269.1 MAG: hypothetical protein E5V21_07165 [Mesorhizobium sp.]
MKVLCLWHATDDEINYIKNAMPSGTEVNAPKAEYFSRFECTYADIECHAVDADAFIGWTMPVGIPEIARKIKILSYLHSGVDDLADIGYLRLATPNTSETLRFFGNAELDAMKPSAFLVNIARGQLVQEKPLYDALTTGRLRGYAADVWPRYIHVRTFPVSYEPRLEIHRLPNVIGSHDQSHNADDVLERYIEWGVENLVEYATGKPLTREINLELGY